MDQTTAYKKAVDQTAQIVANVKPDQLGQPTPCADWDVKGLLNHTIGGLHMFDAAARGEKLPDDFFEKDQVGKDPAKSYDAGAKKVLEALAKPGVTEQMWELPFGTMPGTIALGIAMIEVGLHGWDLARATNQQPNFDPELTEMMAATARMMPADQIRQPNVFGPEATCPPGAPAHDQLAAFLGREVG
jgi:uncharacterized protein (TIGR03086 family)